MSDSSMQRPGTAASESSVQNAERGILGWIDRDITGPLQDFQDPHQEWRRLFSELYGTFLLVLVAAGGGMMGEAFPNTITRTAAVVAPGLMVLAIIMFMGKVSGAHLNPAVSVAFSLRGNFPWRRRAGRRRTPAPAPRGSRRAARTPRTPPGSGARPTPCP